MLMACINPDNFQRVDSTLAKPVTWIWTPDTTHTHSYVVRKENKVGDQISREYGMSTVDDVGASQDEDHVMRMNVLTVMTKISTNECQEAKRYFRYRGTESIGAGRQ